MIDFELKKARTYHLEQVIQYYREALKLNHYIQVLNDVHNYIYELSKNYLTPFDYEFQFDPSTGSYYSKELDKEISDILNHETTKKMFVSLLPEVEEINGQLRVYYSNGLM